VEFLLKNVIYNLITKFRIIIDVNMTNLINIVKIINIDNITNEHYNEIEIDMIIQKNLVVSEIELTSHKRQIGETYFKYTIWDTTFLTYGESKTYMVEERNEEYTSMRIIIFRHIINNKYDIDHRLELYKEYHIKY
tara:strand:+ start:3109 stop:3516 length:408 start_codon:yes stop_codon:yes gene_type:complete